MTRDFFEQSFIARHFLGRALRHLAQNGGVVFVHNDIAGDGVLDRIVKHGRPPGDAYAIVERCLVELEREFKAEKAAKDERRRKRARRSA